MRLLMPLLLIGCLLQAAPAHAQDESTQADVPATTKDPKKTIVTEEDFPIQVEDPAVRKEFSRGEVQKICKKYRGQLIAYYGEVFRVEDCERRPIINNKTVYSLLRSGKKIIDVDGDTIAALPEGEPVDLATTLESARSCKSLEGSYVTFSSVDVYIVEHCKKRLFPDWETYIRHRQKRGEKKGEILSLSSVEFESLEAGKPIVSIFDDIFAKLLYGSAEVDVIPVDEACAGVNNHLVSYYSRLYRIERCRKREVTDPESYLRHGGASAGKIKELTSEQWLSLPDGQPVIDKPRAKK